ncbi:MAG: acylphosphatase [Candidatus Altiarchaeota archaeon]
MVVKRLHMFISGMVQGVFFRANVRDKAVSLDLKGWVRNLLDGRVEVVAEGEEEKLFMLHEYASSNPGYAKVDDVQADFEKPKSEFKDFRITYME